MKVLFLASNVAGVAFWRMFQSFWHLKQMGVDCFLYGMDLEQNTNAIGWQANFAKGDKIVRQQVFDLCTYADIIVLQYTPVEIILGLQLMYQEEFNKVVLTEIDDNITQTPNYNPSFREGYRPGGACEKAVMEQLRASNGVIVSTVPLKEDCLEFNKRVDVIHNAIDFERWNHPVRNGGKKLRIGWIGGGNHERDLSVLKGVIPEILKRYKNVEFVFGHGMPKYLEGISDRVIADRKWCNIKSYPKRVASLDLDIGIAPLEFNRFNECKSNLRWLEYSSLGIPSICTNIYPYSNSIVQGKTGMLADSETEWINALSTLIDSPEMRLNMGRAARQEVKDKWEIKKVTKVYKTVLEGYYEQKRLEGRN